MPRSLRLARSRAKRPAQLAQTVRPSNRKKARSASRLPRSPSAEPTLAPPGKNEFHKAALVGAAAARKAGILKFKFDLDRFFLFSVYFGFSIGI
jgi:hypothetical protein